MAIIEEDSKESTRRISEVEKVGAVMDNKYENIMNAIGKIELSVDRIDKRLEALEKEKGKKWDWLAYLVGGGIIMSVINYFMSMIMKG